MLIRKRSFSPSFGSRRSIPDIGQWGEGRLSEHYDVGQHLSSCCVGSLGLKQVFRAAQWSYVRMWASTFPLYMGVRVNNWNPDVVDNHL